MVAEEQGDVLKFRWLMRPICNDTTNIRYSIIGRHITLILRETIFLFWKDIFEKR